MAAKAVEVRKSVGLLPLGVRVPPPAPAMSLPVKEVVKFEARSGNSASSLRAKRGNPVPRHSGLPRFARNDNVWVTLKLPTSSYYPSNAPCLTAGQGMNASGLRMMARAEAMS
jgi:hypothetical protein